MLRNRLNFVRNLVVVRETSPSRVRVAVGIAREAIDRYGAMQKPSELAPFLALLLKDPPAVVVEIGLGDGGMLWSLCRVATKDATVVSVDLPGGPFGGSDTLDRERLRSYGEPGQRLHLVEGDSSSQETIGRVAALAPQVDLLFIDGDHTYAGVESDYRLYSSLVRPGGMVAFHDILPHDAMPECQVDRLWDELDGRKLAIVSESEQANWGGRWGGVGVLYQP